MPVASSRSSIEIFRIDPKVASRRTALVPQIRVLLVLAVVIVLLYCLPCLVELLLLKSVGPWLACVVLGNLLGCVILFNWGMRRTAIGIYLTCALIESGLLATHAVSWLSLIGFTNAVPAAVIAVLIALITAPDGTFE